MNGWPPNGADTVYDYCFRVWPDETNESMKGNSAVFPLFRMLRTSVVMEFTEKAFGEFRVELWKVGLRLGEIERLPHFDPEMVL